jgi:hypothetical protein
MATQYLVIIYFFVEKERQRPVMMGGDFQRGRTAWNIVGDRMDLRLSQPVR